MPATHRVQFELLALVFRQHAFEGRVNGLARSTPIGKKTPRCGECTRVALRAEVPPLRQTLSPQRRHGAPQHPLHAGPQRRAAVTDDGVERQASRARVCCLFTSRCALSLFRRPPLLQAPPPPPFSYRSTKLAEQRGRTRAVSPANVDLDDEEHVLSRCLAAHRRPLLDSLDRRADRAGRLGVLGRHRFGNGFLTGAERGPPARPSPPVSALSILYSLSSRSHPRRRPLGEGCQHTHPCIIYYLFLHLLLDCGMRIEED